MIRLQNKMLLVVTAAALFTACTKDKQIVITTPPSDGGTVQFQGLAGAEAGSAAKNSVYFDLSSDSQTVALRTSWDLGFYSGSDFSVILNNTTSAGAKVLTTNDLNAVVTSDTAGLTLAVSQTNPQPTDLAFFDDIDGDLTKTAIPEISATDADNKVIILNRGTGGGTATRPWIKLRILRNGAGYTVQYAPLTATTFTTLNISKDAAYHFTYASFETGKVSVQPEKNKWDLVWSYSLFRTDFGGGTVPYNFSDLIAVNYLSGITVAEKTYLDATAATAAYNAFNKDSVTGSTLAAGRWKIGSGWRSTQPATGAKLNKFYVIKDAQGNFYKFRCLAMGVGTDGGTRGKPDFSYALIK